MKNIITRLRQTAVALWLSVAALSSQAWAPPWSASETLVSSTARASSACIEWGSADKAMWNPEFCGEWVDPVTFAASGASLLWVAGAVGAFVRRRRNEESIDISKCPPLMQESLRQLDTFLEDELPGIKVMRTLQKRKSSYTFGITQWSAEDLTVEINVDWRILIYEETDNAPRGYYIIPYGTNKIRIQSSPEAYVVERAMQILLSLKDKLEKHTVWFQYDQPRDPSDEQYDAIDALWDLDPISEADIYLAYGRSAQAIIHLREAISGTWTYDEIILRFKIIDILYKWWADNPNNTQSEIQSERERINTLMESMGETIENILRDKYSSHLSDTNPLRKTPGGALVWVNDADRELYQRFHNHISSHQPVTIPFWETKMIEQPHPPGFTAEQYLEALAALPDRTPIAAIESLLRTIYAGLDIIRTMDSSDARSLQALCEKYANVWELVGICWAILTRLDTETPSVE